MTYVVFDIETTGLDVFRDRIIEIGAVKVIDGQVVDEFEELINPMVDIPRKITQITGIDNNLLLDADFPGVVLIKFLNFIQDADFIIGHNAKKFDYPFLVNEYKRNGIPFDGVICKDTMFEAIKKLGRGRRFSLKSLCEEFGIRNKRAHRALSDVYATHELFLELEKY
jgi:DNA polymerase III epsilon subunit family exonuclease